MPGNLKALKSQLEQARTKVIRQQASRDMVAAEREGHIQWFVENGFDIEGDLESQVAEMEAFVEQQASAALKALEKE